VERAGGRGVRARKVDANHQAMREYFEDLGFLVHSTNGDWDLTVSKFKVVKLIELKDPQSPNLKRKNKGDKLIAEGWPIRRCLTEDDVILLAEEMHKEAGKLLT
jgi:hypothetical protein